MKQLVGGLRGAGHRIVEFAQLLQLGDGAVDQFNRAGHFRQEVGPLRVLRHQPRGQAFEMSAHFHRLQDILDRGALHQIAAPFATPDHAFTFQQTQRQPDRSARDVVRVAQLRFGEPFAFGIGAKNDVLTDARGQFCVKRFHIALTLFRIPRSRSPAMIWAMTAIRA